MGLIVTEGALEFSVAKKILLSTGADIANLRWIDKRGKDAFWADVSKFNCASQHLDYVIGVADLEGVVCASKLLNKHLPKAQHESRFFLRIAVRMIESWLLADRISISRFLDVSDSLIPVSPDGEQNPKQTLVNLARKSRNSVIRRDLVPKAGRSAAVGPGYLSTVSQYVEKKWDPIRASAASPSLKKTVDALRAIKRLSSSF